MDWYSKSSDLHPDRVAAGHRLEVIDLLRGLVIVLMVLDHTRDFFHADAWLFSPTDLSKTTPTLFLTRLVTHLCAPVFVFLAGVSAFLQLSNGKTPATLSLHLLTRGLWLIALELTVVSFGITFAFPFVFLQVIWAIGFGMVALAGFVRLPPAAALVAGIVIVAGHQLLAPIDAADVGAFGALWTMTLEPGAAPLGRGMVMYPAIPWLGVMCLGYGLGFIFTEDAARRRRTVAALGIGALVAFIALRALNGYGDPLPWSVQADDLFTALSFVNVSKYPPSLQFVLLTIDAALLLSLALERLRGPSARVLLAFGRTPLFTYVLHIYLLHLLAMATGVAMGIPASSFVDLFGDPGRLITAGWGFGLATVYVVWLSVLTMLYPASRWFADVKRRRRDWWLGYL